MVRFTCNVVVSELDVEQVYSRLVRFVLQRVLGGRSAFHFQVRTMCTFHRDRQSSKPCTFTTNIISINVFILQKYYQLRPTEIFVH